MRRRLKWSAGWVAAIAGLMATAVGVAPPVAADEPVPVTPLSHAGAAVPLAQAGELVVWSANPAQSTIPAAHAGQAFSQVLMPEGSVIALTAAGRVVGWGSDQYRLQQIPSDVAAEEVVQIAVSGFGFAGAVTRDGRVRVWGVKRTRPTPLNDLPAGLTGVKQLAFDSEQAIALKQDGSVVAWGDPTNGVTNVPIGLRASEIAMNGNTATALTTSGTVVQWGDPWIQAGRPASVEAPGSVKAIAGRDGAMMAWLADDTLVAWGRFLQTLPSSVTSTQPLLLGLSQDNGYAIVDENRTLHVWHDSGTLTPAPPGLNGRPISHVTLGIGTAADGAAVGGAIVTKLLPAAQARMSGVAKVGSVVTGVPGTFSGGPEAVVGQWLVGGVVAPGSGGPLTVTPAMIGKSIAYRSTATKTGETSVSSTSTGTVVPKPAPDKPVPVVSATRVIKVTVAKKAAKVVVNGKVQAAKPSSGRAVITIKKGSKVVVTKSVAVTAAGSVKLTVAKFGKLVIKKTRSKSRTGYRGAYTVTIRYGGNPQVRTSVGIGKFKVK